MAICAYIRVSTDKQTNENQRFEVNNWCAKRGWAVERWVQEDGVSGGKDYKKRKLGQLMNELNDGDTLICCEISRLGRDLMMVMEILRFCMNRNIHVYTIKDNFELSDDLSSKVIAFAFGLAAEIERKLIQQRTKAALDRLKAEGVVLGRPKGVKNPSVKLTGHIEEIEQMLSEGKKKAEICRIFGVNRQTLLRFLNQEGRRDLVGEPPRNLEITEQSLRECASRGMTLARAARTLGVSAHTIDKYAKGFGIDFHAGIEGDFTIKSVMDEIDLKKEEIMERYSNGESFVEIRKFYGYSASIWHAWMKKQGLLYSRDIVKARERIYEMKILLNNGFSTRQISNSLRIYESVVRCVLRENGIDAGRNKKSMHDVTPAQISLAIENGISRKALGNRLKSGWDIKDAISTKVQIHTKKEVNHDNS